MHYYFAGMTVGIILLQAAIVAPSLAKTLSREDFGTSIRVLWPKFFLMVTATGVACLASMLIGGQWAVSQVVIAASTSCFALACYLIIPATNRATDTGNHQKFQRLHLTSVALTVAMLATNIGFLFV